MDGKNRTPEEIDHHLDLPLNLTTASSLYLAIKQGLIVFKWEREEISEKIESVLDSEGPEKNPGSSSDKDEGSELESLKESLEMVKMVISENSTLLKEVAGIIQELELSKPPKKKSIIIKP